MKVLFLGGVLAESNENEVIANSKRGVEFSANEFQKKLISGFEQNGIDVHVISAPMIGSFPFRYKKACFHGFETVQNRYQYVHFNNIWGYRNISRTYSLKQAIKKHLHTKKSDYKLIVAYSAHTPFLEAAVYAKRMCPGSSLCFIVPDLPQYMNLDDNRSMLYDLLKKYDIKKMESLIPQVDCFLVLTEPMKEMLHVGDRPYIVVEGIIDAAPIINDHFTGNYSDGIKRIVYTGKMNVRFGVKDLVDTFIQLRGAEYRLILCGDGDAKEYIIEKSKQDDRIEYKGQVSPAEARKWIMKADVLVNPRPNNEEYTKYSFPSKNIEYLLSGKPVVAYMLDGMPRYYEEFIYEVKPSLDEPKLTNAILKAINREDHEKKTDLFFKYANEHLSKKTIANAIVKLSNELTGLGKWYM